MILMAFVELWVRPQELGLSAGKHSQGDVVNLVLDSSGHESQWGRGSHITDMNAQTDRIE